jgi:cytochrome d ubiquinol oxidase subunit I
VIHQVYGRKSTTAWRPPTEPNQEPNVEHVIALSRWQFGIVTVYHFIFVPLTIGLAPLVAIMQTAWYRTGDERWLRLTKFFGKLFLINFALGVVTGIVQEFQFGMNWSEYSRFVGDVFGAPLAMEGLAAFFVESTFLGLWIFGWDRLPKGVHLACIWATAIAVNLSAYFIIAANSFMQHPVGVRFNAERGRAELESIWDVLFNNTALWAIPHTIAGAFMVAGTFLAGIGGWWMVRRARQGDAEEASLYRRALRLGAVTVLVAGVAVAITGDGQAKLMFEQQPMKMAAAEALCDTEENPGFSLFAVGRVGNEGDECDVRTLSIPGVTSFLATGEFGQTIEGVNDLQAQAVQKWGEGDYIPNLPVTYWSFRLMIGFGVFGALLGLWALWITRGGRIPDARWFGRICLLVIPTPFLANAFGWIFTEMGRQPWIVVPNPTGLADIRMLVADGVSRHGATPVIISLTAFTLVYGGLAIVWFGLITRYAALGAPDVHEEVEPDAASGPLTFAY